MNWETPPPGFQYILFERIEPEQNVARYYYLAFVPTLLGPAVVRLWGRKGYSQRAATPKPFASLEEAWPELRKHIRTRLRRGYCIKEPAAYRGEGDLADDKTAKATTRR